MQISQIITGDPESVKSDLETLALANEILLVQKTISSGKYIVVSDDAGSTGQVIDVFTGDPDTLSDYLTALIGGGSTIEIVANTFSAASYIVVSV